MVSAERRYFRRNKIELPINVEFESDSSTIKLDGTTISIGNGGALIKTKYNLGKYVGQIGNSTLPVHILWTIDENWSVTVPFELLRCNQSMEDESCFYLCALKFLLFTKPIFDPYYLSANLLSIFGKSGNITESTSNLLHSILKKIVVSLSANFGCVYIKDDAAVDVIEKSNEDVRLINSSQIVLSCMEGHSVDVSVLPQQIILENIDSKKDQVYTQVEKIYCDIASSLDGIPVCLVIETSNKIRGAICLVLPSRYRLNTKVRSSIEGSIAEVYKMLEVFHERNLYRDLAEVNRSILSLQSLSPKEFMHQLLEYARDKIECSGLSFFSKEFTLDIDSSVFSLVGTYPNTMPLDSIQYHINDRNFTSMVIKNQSPCIIHSITKKRRQYSDMVEPKWRDIPEGEEALSVMFIPVVRGSIVEGVLRCCNKTGVSKPMQFSEFDLKRTEAFASLIMNWYMAAIKEQHFISSLHDISHEIKQTAAGIKSAARYVIKLLGGDSFFRESNEKVYKMTHILRSVDSLLELLPVLKKDEANENVKTLQNMGFQPYADLCKSICETFRTEAKTRNLSFKYSGNDQLGIIYASLDDFRHIFQNLISNAVKYTYKGKEITIVFQWPLDDPAAMIHVMSESLAIRNDEKEIIFMSGYRSVVALDSKIEGEGRGLAIARGIARQYDGDVVFNARDGYNVFSIIVPKHLFKVKKS